MSDATGVLLLASVDLQRLKTPRILLPFGEKTILERTLEAYAILRPREIVVVSADPPEKLRAGLDEVADQVTLVTSPDVRGRVGLAIKLGVERFAQEPDPLVVGMADQPLLTQELVERLAQAARSGKGTIGVPVCQGIPGHPIFFAREHLAQLASLEPERSHRDLLLAYGDRVTDIPVDQTAVLRTATTPEDYRELLLLAGLPAPPPPQRPAPPEAAERRAAREEEEPETGDDGLATGDKGQEAGEETWEEPRQTQNS